MSLRLCAQRRDDGRQPPVGCFQGSTNDYERTRQDEDNSVVTPCVRRAFRPCHGRLLGEKIWVRARDDQCSHALLVSASALTLFAHHHCSAGRTLTANRTQKLTLASPLHTLRWTVAGASGPSRRHTNSVHEASHQDDVVEYKVEVLTSSRYPAPTGGTKCIELTGPQGTTGEMPLEKLGQTRRFAPPPTSS